MSSRGFGRSFGRGNWHDDFPRRPDRGFGRGFGRGRRFGGPPQFSAPRPRAGVTPADEIFSKTFLIQSKKFYIDVKRSPQGKIVKVSEVAPNGQKIRIFFDIPCAKEFRDRLTDFCDFYTTLGPSKWDRSRMMDNEGKLKCEAIVRDERRYYLDLKENHRGRFLKITMQGSSTHERIQVVIPAQGMIDIRDVFTEIITDYGEDPAVEKFKKAEPISVEPKRAVEKIKKPEPVSVDGKSISFEIGENRRGKFLRISEASSKVCTSVTVPQQSWDKFADIVEQATSDRSLRMYSNVTQ